MNMNAQHRKRILQLFLLILCLSAALGLVLYALRQNINLFFSPSEIANNTLPKGTRIRLGGMVEKGSLLRRDGLNLEFRITDFKKTVKVQYNGILPDLFREGQGVVVQGRWEAERGFVAEQVLAKHDEKYMPPELKSTLDMSLSP